jgi:hypothetical protein
MTVPCRTRVALQPHLIAMPVLTIDTVVRTVAVIADLQDLLADGLIERFTDERGVERFRPAQELP